MKENRNKGNIYRGALSIATSNPDTESFKGKAWQRVIILATIIFS